MFDVGIYEILLILGITFFIFKPDDYPKLIYQAGKWLQKIKHIVQSLKNQGHALWEESEFEQIKEIAYTDMKKKEKACMAWISDNY